MITDPDDLPRTNWAGNIHFSAARVHRPSDVAELQAIVAGASRAKALGTGHSFNPIADTSGDLISTAGLPQLIDVDAAARTVRVSAGTRFGVLAAELDARGFALPNMASLPHISVAGAYATGTHGSGDSNQVLPAAARSLRLVTAGGELRTVEADALAAAVVGLGALGVVVELTLDLVETFRMQQYVYTGLGDDALLAGLDEIFAAGHSVSVFTHWDGTSQVWIKRIAAPRPPAPAWLGARLAGTATPIFAGLDAANCTPQLGVPGPWFERLPHFRAQFTPSFGEEVQSEYFVPRAAGSEAVTAVRSLREAMAPVLLVSELRTVAADELWLSPAYGRDSLALHFTWRRDPERVLPVVAELERRLADLAVRPHWGKVFATSPAAMARCYPRLGEFARLARHWDPDGVFGNRFTDRYLGFAANA